MKVAVADMVSGILLENHVIRHMADIETIHTFEGNETIQTLIAGGRPPAPPVTIAEALRRRAFAGLAPTPARAGAGPRALGLGGPRTRA